MYTVYLGLTLQWHTYIVCAAVNVACIHTYMYMGGWGLLGSGRFCFYTLISFLTFLKFDEGSCWFLRDLRDQARAVRLLIDFLIEGRPLWTPFLTLFNSILKSPSDFLNLCGCELGGSWFFPRPEFSGPASHLYTMNSLCPRYIGIVCS